MKKLLACVLSAALMLSALPLASAAAGYSDLDGHWAQQQVEAFSDLGIVQGYDGKFRPNDSITRGEMAIILDRIMDYQVTARNSFSDLGSAYYTDAVLKANAAGIMLGDGVQVRPTAPITRQEAASMLCRALGLEGGGSLTQFSDRDQVASWAAGAVGAMAARGYISGSNGAFRPTASITRAEVVSILSRAVSRLVSANETVTGNASGDVVVRGAGATLSNMTIGGDLIIAEGVAEGDVKLDNVTVSGRTIIRGGGEHSILMNNVRANGGIVVNKLDGRVRIVTSGSCNVSLTVLQTGAILVGDGFQTVEIPADMAAGQTVELKGNIGRLVNHSAQVSIQAEGRIGTLEASVPTNITGTVRVGSVAQGSSAVTVNSKPVTTTPGTGSSGGSSSGGGGSYQPDPTYRISLDTTAISLQVGQSRTLQATVSVPEGTGNEVYWISSDTSVATVGQTTGQVTAVQAGTATVTASLADKREITASCTVTVTAADTPVQPDTPAEPENPGWNDAIQTDARFAEGYPLCTTENGKVSIKVKVPSASEDNPVDVYMVVNQANSRYTANVDAVIHGHATNTDGKPVWVDRASFIRLTDGEVQTVDSGLSISGNSDIRVDLVLVDRTGTSETVTEVLYGKDLAAELDTQPPKFSNTAFINQARNAVYLHTTDELDLNSKPDKAAFALTGVEGAAVTGVELVQANPTGQGVFSRAHYVKLTVSGINTGTDISSLKVSYTKPDTNPLRDKATTPNATASFSCDVKPAVPSLSQDKLHVSADGRYIYFNTTNSLYFPAKTDFTVTVNKGGQALSYEKNYSWSNDGSSFDVWLQAPSAVLTEGDSVTITVTPDSGTVDYAMDPAQPFTCTGTASVSSISATGAAYSSTDKQLTVSFSGNAHTQGSAVFGCNFQLVSPDGTASYPLRAQGYRSGGNAQLKFDLSNLPAAPEAGWKLVYRPLHEGMSAHSIVTAISGEPMANQEIPITFEATP